MTETIKTSYSALDTFRQCPLKYKFSVIDKIKAPKTKEAVFGNKLHEALQYFHKKSPLSPTLDELLNYIKEIWDPKIFIDEQEDMIYFSEAIKILKNYYENYLRIKDRFTVLDTETRFEVLLENPANKEEKCLLTGIIDRIDKTKDGIQIVDYKTTKKFPAQEEVDNSLQLSLYCLGAMNRWPQFAQDGPEKIRLTLYFLKHHEMISSSRTQEQLDLIKEKVWEMLKNIEKSTFEPMPSALCDWCGYKKLCPMWKHLYKEQFTLDDEQLKKIINEFFELKQANAQNNKKLNELKNIIEQYLDKEKVERVFGDSGYITRAPIIRYKYEPEKIKEILEPLGKWLTVIDINAVRLKNIAKTLPPYTKKEVDQAKKIDKEYRILKTAKLKK